MDNTTYVALSRQMALWKQMDLVSNNMANMNTAGYKGDEALFTTYLSETQNGAKDIVGKLSAIRFISHKITPVIKILPKA